MIVHRMCREADDGSVAVAGARLVPAESYAAAIALFQRGSRSRTVGAACCAALSTLVPSTPDPRAVPPITLY